MVLNNRNYIKKAIENFQGQNCPSAELIIVDGASSDGTKEIIAELASDNENITWISEPDNGQSDAMNKGIRMATSEYISFLNVDDFYEEGALNDVAQLLKRGGKGDFLVGNCKVWKADGSLIYTNRPRKLRLWHLLSGYFLPVNPSAYFYKKSLHEKAGYYNSSNEMNMDIEFLVRSSAVVRMRYFDRDWGNFRMLSGAKTFEDAKQGNLEPRKRQLFRRLKKELGIYIRFRTILFTQWMLFKKRLKL